MTKEETKMMTSSHTTRLLALLVLLGALLAAPVAADITINKYDHHQYMSAAHDEIYVCSCASTVNYYDVTNQGDFAARFDFTMQAEMDWVTLHTRNAYLQPGESTRIAVTIAPPCGLEMDPLYTIHSSSQYGRFAVAQTSVTATVCESIDFSVDQLDNNILPCTQANFDLNLHNVAPYTETYTLAVDDEQNIDISREEVRLAPGERATIPAAAQYACGVSGDQTIRWTATAHSSDNQHTQTSILAIQDDYEYLLQEVDAQASDFCHEVSNTKQVRITNLAETQNTYELSHRGPNFASLSEQQVVLQPGQSKNVQLTIDEHSRPGSYTSTISATTAFGGNQKSLQVSYDTRSCYDNRVTVTPSEQHVCAGPTEFNVRVENRGESTETFTLIPEGDIFSEVSTNQFTLRPAEHQEVVLTASVPDRNQDHTIELTVRQSPGIDKVINIPVTGVSNAACTEISTSEQKLTLYRGETVWPVLLTNDGIRASNYELSIQSDVVTLREEEVFLAPGEQAVLHLEASNLDTFADGQYVAEFRAISDRSEYRKDFHLTVTNKGFFKQLYENVAYGREGYLDWCLLVLVVLAIIAAVLLLLWLVAGGRWELAEGFAKTVMLVLGIVAVLFLAAALISAATTNVPQELADEPRGSNYSELYHEFEQNSRYDLDLAQYFIDPDGDPLTYTHSQPEHLTIVVQDNVARITPERGFSGTQNVVFTATDTAGDSVDSPIMQVRVLGVVPQTAWEWVSAYCVPINFGLLALIALILLGMIATTRRPEEEQQSRQGGALTPVTSSEVVASSGSSATQAVPVANQPQAGTQVGGDVVAGDKVTYVGNGKPQILVASKGGKKAHRRTCATVERIAKDKRVTFPSEKEAIEAGYSGCKMCQSFSD